MTSNVKGFTLVELVTVILILGVLILGVNGIIIFGSRIFVESSSVDQVIGQSRFSVERITRELRNAVPNSVRLTSNTNSQCIEFVPIVASTSYLTMPIASLTQVANGAKVMRDNAQSRIAAGQWAIIYPVSEADVYQQAKAKRFSLNKVTLEANSIDLEFAAPVQFSAASPRKRVYFSSDAVSYCFEQGGDLYRYAAYGLLEVQPTASSMPVARVKVLMGQHVVNDLGDNDDLPLSLTPASLMTNAIVQLQPRFSVLGETFQYRHQVQVINVP
ncbi:PilW family protein [Shewanella sp. SR44-3]|uniref:PilW family protein n=1 Tax=Shewanella sp. SR44-3 TaxID=2760936 RepID=UPI0015FD9C85|nr:prepilin-type N-terminal cleavage/methylation domain-containing protein [Shewanella sp. SR44-3]MBB1269650.1 prepilin-type N-terminal cleavage/methylation domain-containing protein [Shewanella sp. SR44-3]